MFREERLRRIVQMLVEDGQVRVTEAAKRFRVSESTIRLDLHNLENRGLVLRTHGGAILPDLMPGGPMLEIQKAFPERLTEHIAQKRAIGQAAAELVHDGETIMIDGGTTTREACLCLGAHQNLILVTNVVNIYPDLVSGEHVRVVMTGGELDPISMTLMSEVAEVTLARYRASKAILGIDAVSLQFGLTTLDARTAALKKQMIEHSDKCIILADSSKIQKVLRKVSQGQFQPPPDQAYQLPPPQMLSENRHNSQSPFRPVLTFVSAL